MIITNNEAALRVLCENVKPEEIPDLRDELERELQRSARLGRPGIGLAAPQIGIRKKFAIVRIQHEGKENYNLDLANARINAGYDEKIFADEGCLSFPGRVETTKRFQEIYVVNNAVEPKSFIATGLMAVVCQHELDHLHGSLFFDHMIEPSTPVPKVESRNALCPCGSGKKFKKCHLLKK